MANQLAGKASTESPALKPYWGKPAVRNFRGDDGNVGIARSAPSSYPALELHPQKTRLIEFGRYAAERRAKRGEGKPETFNFLGFTHMCGTNYQTGKFTILRKTIGKRMAAKLKEIRAQLRQRMHDRVAGTVKWLQQVVRGYFQYHAVPGNCARLRAFRSDVLWSWLQALRRRSQRHRMSWERFKLRLDSLIPPVQVLHPYPDARFAAKYSQIRGKNRVR